MDSNQKIRVCHLASGDLWAGAESQILTLLSHMRREPLLDLSAVILNRGELADGLEKTGIKVYLIEEKGKSFFNIVNQIEKSLRGKNIDLIHSHRYKENSLAAMLKRRGVIPHLIQTVHGKSEPFKGFSRMRATLSNMVNRYCTRNYFDRVIAVSNDIKNELVNRMPVDRVVTIHNSIDIRLLAPAKSSDDMRAELGIEMGRPIIGTAGRLVPVKGYDILLDAVRKICDRVPEMVFVLAGDGPLRNELESKSHSLGLRDNFLFIGFRNDIIDLINMFDILVMSSHSEGIPIILLEAMGMGKPVVATAVGGIPEIVQDGVSGRLVSPGEADELGDACIEILRDIKMGQRLGQKAKERIIADFQIDSQYKKVLRLYQDVVSAL